MLVGAGAKVDARDVKRQTPLMRAVRGGHEDAVRVLLAANAAPSARDDQKRGSLHRAVRSAAKGQVRLHAGEFLTDFGFFCFFFFWFIIFPAAWLTFPGAALAVCDAEKQKDL